jgi:hypothetical protein
MKKTIQKTFIMSILFFGINNLIAQKEDVGKQRYRVCTFKAGSNCTQSSNLISCRWEYENVDPCTLYDYWYYNESGDLTKGTCCSVAGKTNPQNDEKWTVLGKELKLSYNSFKLETSCNNDSGKAISVIDFSDMVNPLWNTIYVNVFLDNNEDIVVQVAESDTIIPFYKSSSLNSQTFSKNVVLDACSEEGNHSTKIIKVNKLLLEVKPNPVKDGILIIDIPNISENIKYNVEIFNSIGKKIDEFVLSEKSNTINTKKYENGFIFVSINNGFEKQTHKIFIQQ